jgi:hypothetical protein
VIGVAVDCDHWPVGSRSSTWPESHCFQFPPSVTVTPGSGISLVVHVSMLGRGEGGRPTMVQFSPYTGFHFMVIVGARTADFHTVLKITDTFVSREKDPHHVKGLLTLPIFDDALRNLQVELTLAEGCEVWSPVDNR